MNKKPNDILNERSMGVLKRVPGRQKLYTVSDNFIRLYTAVAENSSVDINRCLASASVNVNMTGGDKGSTPLIEAATTYLLNGADVYGADVYTRNSDGDSVFNIAAFWGNAELVEKLVHRKDMSKEKMTRNKLGFSAYGQAKLMRDHVSMGNADKARFNYVISLLKPYRPT